MSANAREDAALSSEQEELIGCLERVQDSFERRALSTMAEPLISTPLTMQQLKVLTMIAIDPEKATGHELAAQLKVNRKTVMLAYEELAAQGWVTSDPMRGTFVSATRNMLLGS